MQSDIDSSAAVPAELEATADFAEYVLGTLEPDARVGVDARCAEDPQALADLVRWQDRVAALAGTVGEQSPSPAVWQRILAGMQADARADAPGAARGTDTRALPLESGGGSLWGSLAFWRGLSVAGVASATALVAMLVLAPRPSVPQGGPVLLDQPDMLSVLATEEGAGIWLVKLDDLSGTVRVKVLNPQPAGADRDFELWLVPGDGTAPRSLGVLPANHDERLPLRPEVRAALPAAAALAVSIEPAGGSPTGAPTGPVRFTGQVFQL